MRWMIPLALLGLLTACGSSSGSSGGSNPPSGNPRIDYVSPDSGPQDGGGQVSIRGAGFSSGVISVLFGQAAASDIEVTSDSNLNCTTPPNARGTVDVQVNTDLGPAYLPAGYTYNPGPEVFFVAPTAGYVGLTVSVVGFNFVSNNAGPTSVFFGTEEARSVQVVNDYTIFCAVPPSPSGGVVDVTVVNRNGEDTLRNGFFYLNAGLFSGRLTVPFELELENMDVMGILDANLETGVTEVYTPQPRGGGHTWTYWGELLLPFAPDAVGEED